MGPGEQCANPCRIRGADEAATRERHHLTGLSQQSQGPSLEPSSCSSGSPGLPVTQPFCLPSPFLAQLLLLYFFVRPSKRSLRPPVSAPREGWKVQKCTSCFSAGYPLLCVRRTPESSSPKSSCSLSTYLSIDNVVRPGHLVRWNFWGQASRNLLGIHTKIQSIPFI